MRAQNHAWSGDEELASDNERPGSVVMGRSAEHDRTTHDLDIMTAQITMRSRKLDLLPEPLAGDSDITSLVKDAFRRVEPDVPLFRILEDTVEPVQAFVAHTPDIALEWICRQVSKAHLMQVINRVYDDPDEDVSDESQPPAKRARHQKETTTRQVNKRLKEQMDNALLEAIASTQDLVAARRTEITYSAEEQKYRNFAKQLHGAGISEVAEMIIRAGAIGTFACLQDWRVVLETWREVHRDGRRLFANMGPKLPMLKSRAFDEVTGSGDEQHVDGVLSQVTVGEDRLPALTRAEVNGFRSLLATVRRSETAGILGDVRHRWIMAALYAEYEQLENLLRKRVKLTSTRGRGVATVAREQLFQEVCQQEDGIWTRDSESSSKYRSWNRYLDYGKRWFMLKERFGIGILALFPRGGVSNSFVERRPIKRLEDWMDMLAKCNNSVMDMSTAIEPLLVSCMREEEPPEMLRFEMIDEDEFRDMDRMDCFELAEDTQRSFEIVRESVEVEESQFSETQEALD
jgi:hypothetical protein